MSDVSRGYTALAEAADGYATARRYYDGDVEEVFSSPMLKRLLAKSGSDKFKMNVIRSVVNSIADRLDVMSVTVAGDSRTDANGVKISGPVQARLDSIRKTNALAFEESTIMRKACRDGDALVLVWPRYDDTDGDQAEDDAEPAPLDPVVNYLPPTACRIIYDTDNPREKEYAIHAWTENRAGDNGAETRKVWRANLFYPDRVERWETLPGQKPDQANAWTESPSDPTDPESWRVDNPYGVVPVFHLRNGTPYGEPEHLHGYGAQDAVNKIVIAHMSTLDYYVAPQRYALLDGADDESGPDDFDLDEFDQAIEPKSSEERKRRDGLRSGPGELWMLPGVKSVGEFSAASSSNFTDPAAFYLRMLAQTTETPLHMIDDSADEPSGEARRRKEAPLTEKIKNRAALFAQVWGDIYAFALKVAGLDGHEVVVKFAPAEVVSDAEGWSTIKAKIEAGVPVRQALAEAGYTTDQIDEWYPEGEENGLRITDLQAVADILQKIGAAVALGIITADEGRAMLPEGVLPEGADDQVAPAPNAPPPIATHAEDVAHKPAEGPPSAIPPAPPGL